MMDPSAFPRSRRVNLEPYPGLRLPISLLTRYLFFLGQRPISSSNAHYLRQRLAGLKTLAGALEGEADIPGLDAGIRQLATTSPANFYRSVERLRFTLLPLSHAVEEIPADVIVSNSPPTGEFITSAREILLLLGPAIGIGDEIILFALPRWLKEANPRARVSVCSAYPGLWERVAEVDRTLQYSDYVTVLEALRGTLPFDRYELVILADFERPGLCPSVCYEARPTHYVELGLGTQSICAVDNRRRWLHHAPRPSPYFANFYHGLDYLVRWLGLTPRNPQRFATIVRRTAQPAPDHSQIYVNPFTSKYEPSEPYWSHLLGCLVPDSPSRQVEFVMEVGPNSATMRFASTVVRSVRARAPAGVSIRLAEIGQGPTRSLQDVLHEIERAHVVLCSDSFAAHAAPLFGCASLVLARAGLENWRVPHASSYYFDGDTPIDQTVAAMQQVLKRLDILPAGPGDLPSLPPSVRDLEHTTRELQGLFESGDVESVLEAFRQFIPAYQEVVEGLADWPAPFSAMLDDASYALPFYSLNDGEALHAPPNPDLLLHLQDRWQQWQNTNLRKYLGLLVGHTDSTGST